MSESPGIPALLVAMVMTGAWTPLSFGTLVALPGTVCALADGKGQTGPNEAPGIPVGKRPGR